MECGCRRKFRRHRIDEDHASGYDEVPAAGRTVFHEGSADPVHPAAAESYDLSVFDSSRAQNSRLPATAHFLDLISGRQRQMMGAAKGEKP
jgi:hypothetical protein